MYIFFTIFFIVYSGVHVYTFLKARAAFSFRAVTGVCLAIFLAAMVVAPLLVRMFERAGQEYPARLTAHSGYLWLGVTFLFFSSSVALDIYQLFARMISLLLRKEASPILLTARQSFIVAAAFSIVASAYGYIEAKNIRVERVTIKSSKLKAGSGPLRIVQISDVHLGLMIREERLKRIVEIVRAAKPDIVLSTGDLVDGEIYRLNGLSDLLREITPKYGKFAITGNHEFFAGIRQAGLFIENSGFTLLRDEAVPVSGFMTIAGMDDPVAKNMGLRTGPTERELLSSLPRERFTILMKHRPIVAKNSEGLFDLQVSGHVHKGQIFPFTLITKLYYPVESGLASLPGNSLLYVSRGTGTWGPPIRFLAPPEIAILDIVPAEGPPKS